MDFIEGFLKVGGKSVVLTVVDRFSKFAHFIAFGHPYRTVQRQWPRNSLKALCGFMAFRAPL
jgi:hypothetical protein